MFGDESITLASINLPGASTFGEEQNEVLDKKKNSSPPTNIIVKDHFTTEDYDTMLKLAREKFDELRRMSKDRGSASSRYTRARTARISKDEVKITRLLSSLLYLSLMMNKVDDMKQALEHHDCTLYREWEGLFTSLHSPLFHLKERKFQNERTKKIFSRKLRYKDLYNETKETLHKASETSKEMSEAITKLTESNNNAQAKLEAHFDLEKRLIASEAKIESLKKSLEDKMDLLRASDAMKSALQCTVSELQSDKSTLLKKIEDDSVRLYDLSEGNDYLKNVLEGKNNDIFSLKEKITLLEEQGKSADALYKTESTKYEETVSNLRKDLDEKISSSEYFKLEYEKSTQSHDALKKKLEDDIQALTKQATAAECELKSCRVEMEMIKQNLHAKDLEIANAKDEVQIQTNHQNKWRESIAQKDKEISKLYAALRDTGARNSQSDTDKDRDVGEMRLKSSIEELLKEFLKDNIMNKELERQLEESKHRESQLVYEKEQLEIQIKKFSEKDTSSKNMMNELMKIHDLLSEIKKGNGKLQCPVVENEDTDMPTTVTDTKQQAQNIIDNLTKEIVEAK